MNKAFQQAEIDEIVQEIEKNKQDAQKRLEEYYKRVIETYNPDDPEMEKKLEAEWKDMVENFTEEDFADHWQKASDMVETQYMNMKKNYAFNQENEYLKSNQPQRLFLDLIKQGRTGEAIKALEAHLQKNPTDHNGWVMLGGLLQENDQDQKSVTALLKAVELKPDCLSGLLMLGVGCTNILDELHSVMYLQRWLKMNPKFNQFAGAPLVCPHKLALGDYDTTEIMAINHLILERFEEAKLNGGFNDSDFCMAYGVIAYIGREYKLSVDMMNRAVEIDPHNFTAWNKLGACLAQLNEPDMGRMAYRKALDLKPNYIRPWVNLGMSYSSKVVKD